MLVGGGESVLNSTLAMSSCGFVLAGKYRERFVSRLLGLLGWTWVSNFSSPVSNIAVMWVVDASSEVCTDVVMASPIFAFILSRIVSWNLANSILRVRTVSVKSSICCWNETSVGWEWPREDIFV